MTDYFDVPIVYTGDWIDAAWINQYIGDNLRAFKQGFVNGGDIAYAIDGNTIGALAKPGGLGILTNNASGTLAWVTGGSALQGLRKNVANNAYEWASMAGLHTKATVAYNASEQSISATSYTDITNATVNIVTTKTCTIVMLAYGVMAVNSAGNRAFVQAVIGGTGSGDTGAPHTSSPYYVPFAINYYRTGVSAGTIACKLQGRANAGGNAGIFERGRIIVMAFEE